jgi:hypothetical protein
MPRSLSHTAAVAAVLALLLGSWAGAAPEGGITFRLVHLRDGLRETVPEGDLARLAETDAGREAKQVDVDLLHPPNPLVAWKLTGGRLYYVFHKTIDGAFADRPYVIQRIKKTERTWRGDASAAPEEKVTYLVEVMKLFAGGLKRSDQHYGAYSLRDARRREVVKEYEIGFGEIPGTCEGTRWPFADNRLYELLQPYQDAVGQYATAKFASSRRWTLTVTLDRDGSYAVRAPELGIDLPKAPPDVSLATPPPDPASKDLVLETGVGVAGLRVGASTADDLKTTLGRPLEDLEAGNGSRLLSFRRAVSCNLDAQGKLKTVLTRPGFAGKTKEGVAHGDDRPTVMKRLGTPAGQLADAPTWRYPGIQVSFDGFERVARIVITKL